MPFVIPCALGHDDGRDDWGHCLACRPLWQRRYEQRPDIHARRMELQRERRAAARAAKREEVKR